MMDTLDKAIDDGKFDQFLDNNGNFSFDLVAKSTQIIEPELPNELELNHPSQGVHIIEDEDDMKFEIQQEIKQYRKQQLYHDSFPKSNNNDDDNNDNNNNNNNNNIKKKKHKIKLQSTLQQYGFQFVHGCAKKKMDNNNNNNKQFINYTKGILI